MAKHCDATRRADIGLIFQLIHRHQYGPMYVMNGGDDDCRNETAAGNGAAPAGFAGFRIARATKDG